MHYDPRKHDRRSIRLKGHDYSQPGAYFVTLVSYQRESLFGQVVNRKMRLNAHGRIADEYWRGIPLHFANVELDVYVVMPNHLHGIIEILEDMSRGEVISPGAVIFPGEALGEAVSPGAVIFPDEALCEVISPHESQLPTHRGEGTIDGPGGGTPPLQKPTLGQIVAYFKYQSTKEMNLLDGNREIAKYWQRNYHDDVVCNQRELETIRRYIQTNPANWLDDDQYLRREG